MPGMVEAVEVGFISITRVVIVGVVVATLESNNLFLKLVGHHPSIARTLLTKP